jgi:hypothetical protein
MSKEFDAGLAHLKWLHFGIRHCCAQAEAKMGEVNRLVQQRAGTGFAQETVFLGEVIHPRYYPPAAHDRDCGQVAQAALCVPGGIGGVLWDAEQCPQLRTSPEGLKEAKVRFRPFERCEPVGKALLLPHIEALRQGLGRRPS